MLSGITFVIVLIWLRLSLESELRSVCITFEKAKALDLKDDEKAETLNRKDEKPVTKHPILRDAYQVLGIDQIFTCIETLKSSTSKHPFQPQVIFKRLMRASFLLACLIAMAFLLLDIYPLQLVKIPADILIAIVIIRFLMKARQQALSHRTNSNKRADTNEKDPLEVTSRAHFWQRLVHFLGKARQKIFHRRDSNKRGDISEDDPLEVTSHAHFWQHLSLGLYGMPGIVLLYIFRDDLATLKFG